MMNEHAARRRNSTRRSSLLSANRHSPFLLPLPTTLTLVSLRFSTFSSLFSPLGFATEIPKSRTLILILHSHFHSPFTFHYHYVHYTKTKMFLFTCHFKCVSSFQGTLKITSLLGWKTGE